jgi:magnesium transporter
LHPATVAEALADEFEVEEVWRFLQHTNIRTQAAIFEYFPIDWQVKMVEGTGRAAMARLIEQMSHDDRADLLRRLRPRVAEALLRLVDEADRRDIATLVRYEENTAGALMTTDYAWLPAHITAAEALDRLRLQAPNSETIYYVYVLNEHRKLIGVVSLRDLILAPRQAPLRELMETKAVTVRAQEDREKVAQEIAHYDLLALPVVDDENRLIGIVTHDDVIDVVVQEATEDVHRLGAVQPMAENYLEANFVTVWRKRAFWLGCLFVGELLTFTAMERFEEALAEVVVLSLFVPLCISTGGNSGSQAATLITRSLALGQVKLGDWLRVLRHELGMGLALGLTLGTLGFLRGVATMDDTRGNLVRQKAPFQIEVPLETPHAVREDGNVVKVTLPAGALQSTTVAKNVQVLLPEGEQPVVEERGSLRVYRFPENSRVRSEAVSRWSLAWVVGVSVSAICLWGTLVGSMLPVLFMRLGVDPGIASSPFVATAVDVTGILIYFSIATAYLL